MKTANIKYLYALLLAVLLTIAPVVAQETGSPSLDSQTALVKELDVNGLKVLVKKRKGSRTVAVGLFVRGGVKNLTAENAGIEDFALKVATEATTKFPRDVMRREIARTGSVVGASSSLDYSVLSISSIRANFDRSWEIFSDIIWNPTFSPEDVDRIREQILTGLRDDTDDPDSFLSRLSDQSAYAGHPYLNRPNGTIENISRFKPEDLRRYYKGIMQTSRLLLVIVGDLDVAQLQPKLNATFGKMPRENYQDTPIAELVFPEPRVDITSRELPTNYVQGIFTAPSPTNPDIYPMRVAMAILRDRVFEEVRVRRNLSYAPSAFINNNAANTGGIYVSAVDANQSIGIMLDEIKKLQNGDVDDSDLSGVVGQYLTNFYLGQETNNAQATDLALSELIGGGWRNSFEFLSRIRAVKAGDVQRVAKKYMKNIRFVVLGNPANVNQKIFTRQN
jgi:predicted Zn-dependent peptidase